MKDIKYVILLFFLILILPNCRNSEEKNICDKGRTIRDMLGREVKIPEQTERIIALNAGMLRFITWLDATNYIIGVEGNEKRRHIPYLYAYPELRDLPRIGTKNQAEPELIISLKPDVILSTYINAGEAERLQEKTGVPVIAVKYGNFDNEIDTVYTALRFIGKLLNKENRAEDLIDFINETINDLRNRAVRSKENYKPSVYIGGIAYRGSHGITSTEPRYPSFSFLNAKNVAGELKPVITSPRSVMMNAFIDKEQLIEWNPEYVFLDGGSFFALGNKLINDEWMSYLKAFRNGRVYIVFPYNWYSTNYSTILVNSYFIGKVLYPDSFSDVDFEKKADEIYSFILGKKIYKEMKERYGSCRKLKIDEQF